MKKAKVKAARKTRKQAATRRPAKKPARKKTAVKKTAPRKAVARKAATSGAPLMRAYSNSSGQTVTILAKQIHLPHCGRTYLQKLDFSQAPTGAGTFDNTMYSVWLHATDLPGAVIQEDQNNKTEGMCAWTIYVPDDGYQSPVSLTVEGQMSGTGWTGGSEVDGLWLTPEEVG
jgi:hypothetical protein